MISRQLDDIRNRMISGNSHNFQKSDKKTARRKSKKMD